METKRANQRRGVVVRLVGLVKSFVLLAPWIVEKSKVDQPGKDYNSHEKETNCIATFMQFQMFPQKYATQILIHSDVGPNTSVAHVAEICTYSIVPQGSLELGFISETWVRIRQVQARQPRTKGEKEDSSR